MRKAILILTLLVAFAIQPVLAATPNADEAIRDVLNKQTEAWNKGDLDGFMTAYYKSPDLSYVSGGTEVWGYDALRARYSERYGKTPETMGKLSTTDLRVFPLGETSALAIGRWHLERKDQPEISGVYSLVLIKAGDQGWKIMHDHTSLSEPRH